MNLTVALVFVSEVSSRLQSKILSTKWFQNGFHPRIAVMFNRKSTGNDHRFQPLNMRFFNSDVIMTQVVDIKDATVNMQPQFYDDKM